MEEVVEVEEEEDEVDIGSSNQPSTKYKDMKNMKTKS